MFSHSFQAELLSAQAGMEIISRNTLITHWASSACAETCCRVRGRIAVRSCPVASGPDVPVEEKKGSKWTGSVANPQ